MSFVVEAIEGSKTKFTNPEIRRFWCGGRRDSSGKTWTYNPAKFVQFLRYEDAHALALYLMITSEGDVDAQCDYRIVNMSSLNISEIEGKQQDYKIANGVLL